MKIYDYEERLYSTGSYELDELHEKAFCDGYEFAQKEFGWLGRVATKITRNNAARQAKQLRTARDTSNTIASKMQAKGINSTGNMNPENFRRAGQVANADAMSLVRNAQRVLPKSGKGMTREKFVGANKEINSMADKKKIRGLVNTAAKY